MTRLRTGLLFAALAAAVYFGFGLWLNRPDGGEEIATVPTEPREPIDWRFLPKDIYERVCRLGHPVLVSDWDLTPETRFVYFEGPFIESADDENRETYPYMYSAIESMESGRVTTSMLLQSIDEYSGKVIPEDLSALKIPIIRNGLPDDPAKLPALLGEPDVEQSISKRTVSRLIYQKRLCFGDRLLAGLYVDISDGAIIRAKGIETDVEVDRLIRREVLPDPDPEPMRYVDEKPLQGSGQETFVEFILARESGDQAAALAFFSDSQTNDWIRNEATAQSEPGIGISLESFTYQTTKYEWGAIEMRAVYYLKNGSLMDSQHRLREEPDGSWRLEY